MVPKVLSAVVVFTLLLSLSSHVYAGSCGPTPPRPPTPPGCTDITPQCVCDSTGQNCHWEWVCVK